MAEISIDDVIEFNEILHPTKPNDIGSLSIIDGGEEDETFTFTLSDNRFEIQPRQGGGWSLFISETASGFDFENADDRSFTLTITAFDSDGELVASKGITINLRDDDEAPTDITVTGGTISPDAAVDSVVATLDSTDPDQEQFPTLYYLVDKDQNEVSHPYFKIEESEIKLKAKPPAGTYTFYVKAVDDDDWTLSYMEQITITVAGAPTDIILQGGVVAENANVGTTVATLTGVDPNSQDVNALTYTLVEANPYFMIEGNQIKLKTGLPDAQVGTHTLQVKATDPGGLSYTEQVTITVTDSANVINGSSKNDNRLNGTADDDIISGLAGNDKINGLAGNDMINGGAGKDKLYGGEGQDTFVFDTAVKKGHFDQIMDFKPSDDTIQISLAALKAFKVKGPKPSDVHSKKSSDDKSKPDDKGSSKSVGFDKIFVKGQKLQKKFFNVGTKLNDTPDGSNDYVFYNKKNGFVYLDMDGSGKGKGIEILKVKPGTALTADDFLFI